jgi:hypothetical protein
MTHILCGTAILMAAIMFQPRPAQAYEAPWCAVVSMGAGDAYWDCQYRSVEECAPVVVAGNRGTCNPNPAFQGQLTPQKQGSRRRHR